MKKIITFLSALLLPTVSFAQGYTFRLMNCANGGYNCNGFQSVNSVWDVLILLLIPTIWVFFIIVVFIFWLSMLIDAIKNAPKETKLIWVIVIIFTHIIGALIYYFVEKKQRHLPKTEHTEHKN